MEHEKQNTFDSLLRLYIGRELRADGFKVAKSRTYTRPLPGWSQEVHLQRLRNGKFVFNLQLNPDRVATGFLWTRYSEGRGDVLLGGYGSDSDFVQARDVYRTRISPWLNEVANEVPKFDALTADALKGAGTQVGPFHLGRFQLLLLAHARWREGRMQDAADFARSTLEATLPDGDKALAREMLPQIEDGVPYEFRTVTA